MNVVNNLKRTYETNCTFSTEFIEVMLRMYVLMLLWNCTKSLYMQTCAVYYNKLLIALSYFSSFHVAFPVSKWSLSKCKRHRWKSVFYWLYIRNCGGVLLVIRPHFRYFEQVERNLKQLLKVILEWNSTSQISWSFIVYMRIRNGQIHYSCDSFRYLLHWISSIS